MPKNRCLFTSVDERTAEANSVERFRVAHRQAETLDQDIKGGFSGLPYDAAARTAAGRNHYFQYFPDTWVGLKVPAFEQFTFTRSHTITILISLAISTRNNQTFKASQQRIETRSNFHLQVKLQKCYRESSVHPILWRK